MPKKLIGVAPVFLTFDNTQFPKRELLLFDEIYVPGLDVFRDKLNGECLSNLELLEGKGILKDFEGKLSGNSDFEKALTELNEFKRKYGELTNKKVEVPVKYYEHQAFFHVFFSRAVTAYLNEAPNNDAISIITPKEFNNIGSQKVNFRQALRVAIHNLPVPHESTPLKDILQFRNEKDTQQKISALRRWIKKVAISFDKPEDLQEEIEYLIQEYKKYMDIQQLKYSVSTFEAVITTAADLIEDLAKFKLKKLVEKAFSIFKQDVQLLESELKAPGKEVAYFIHAQDRFS